MCLPHEQIECHLNVVLLDMNHIHMTKVHMHTCVSRNTLPREARVRGQGVGEGWRAQARAWYRKGKKNIQRTHCSAVLHTGL